MLRVHVLSTELEEIGNIYMLHHPLQILGHQIIPVYLATANQASGGESQGGNANEKRRNQRD